jgi:hypothetical protein
MRFIGFEEGEDMFDRFETADLLRKHGGKTAYELESEGK